MGYLYKDPHPREFIERRYARIFPPFLVMVFCMWIFHLNPSTPLLVRIGLMLVVAYIVRLIWIHIVERFHKGSVLITLFMIVQFVVAIWYGFFIMRRPPIWFDSLPFFIREGTILAANVTQTLSLGNYIPLLDGVYWSLAPEMIFYLLYPFLFAQTTQRLQKKSVLFITLFFISLFPFFFGLSLLFKHTNGLSMLFIEYFIYFCGGIGIATIVHSQTKRETPHFLQLLTTPISFLIVLFLSFFLLGKVSGINTVIVRLLLVFPFGYIVYSLIEHDTSLTRVFQHKIFIFLGTISYSMYIGHTALVDGMHLILKPYNVLTNLLFLLVTGFVFFVVSIALHSIIEKPYFQFKPVKKPHEETILHSKVSYGVLFMFVLFLFFSAYTSQFNFFSLQKKYTNIIPASITISDIPYTFTFTSQEDNMGVILVHLTNTVGNEKIKSYNPNPYVFQRFQIRMKEEGSKEWYASQDIAPAEIGDSSSYPFGFPPISNSKNKKYSVEMSIKNIDHRSTVIFNKDIYPLSTIHQIPKQTLFKNPIKLMTHLSDKLQTALTNSEAQLTAMCILPFFILLFVL
jgi:peptidoglycan/LPS O-acetylase OafA/YrhL